METDMSKTRAKAWVMALLSLSVVGASAGAAPLFESDETLAIVLEFPVNDLLRQAKKKPTVEGRLHYNDADKGQVVLDISVTTRGKSRLEQCRYPPLSVNLKKKQTVGTVFAGQNKLKLVTPCQKKSTHKAYLRQEYAIYRAYNQLTDYSFQVRMLEVTFRDSEGKRKDEVHEAFFIEPLKGATSRLGMRTISTRTVKVSQLDPEQLSIMSLFHYMIGNTDWSASKGPANEDCCHNGKVIGRPDSTDGWVVLPYDFDQSGIIHTDYSVPAEQLRLRSVRQRKYRGYCGTIDQMNTTITLFNDKRGAIEELFGSAAERESTNKTALKYLESFYEIINDPDKRKKKIVDACR